MITCSQCGAQNLPGLAYCENCGSPLPQQAAAPGPVAPSALPSDSPVAPQAAPPIDVSTPAAPAGAAVGANLVAADPADASAAAPVAAAAPTAPADAAPAAPDQTAPAASAPSQAAPVAPTAPASAGTLTLTFPSGQVFTMQGDAIDVGRADVAQSWHPELDVIPFGGGAPDLGVSRHQARILRQDGAFVVIDVGSTNGTYINGRAAPYNQPAELHDGETLSFGALNTQVSIK